MVDYGRNLDIGIPPADKTLRDIYDKLGEVEGKIEDTTDTIDEANLELKKVSLGTGLVTGVDLDEEVE